jgi:hypothetical protein
MCLSARLQDLWFGRGGSARQTAWTDSRGIKPSTVFPQGIARQGVLLYNPGDLDNFFTFYGIWWSSQLIPVNPDGSIDFCNQGTNNGNFGWVYMSIRGYAIPTTTPLANLNSGAQLIIWQPFITPLLFEWTYTTGISQVVPLTGVPFGARYVLADFFITTSISDEVVYCT